MMTQIVDAEEAELSAEMPLRVAFMGGKPVFRPGS